MDQTYAREILGRLIEGAVVTLEKTNNKKSWLVYTMHQDTFIGGLVATLIGGGGVLHVDLETVSSQRILGLLLQYPRRSSASDRGEHIVSALFVADEARVRTAVREAFSKTWNTVMHGWGAAGHGLQFGKLQEFVGRVLDGLEGSPPVAWDCRDELLRALLTLLLADMSEQDRAERMFELLTVRYRKKAKKS